MSISRRLPARIEYRCDICGRVGVWDEGTWRRYSSHLHDETVPQEQLPHVCSDACATELDRRITAGLIELPKLRVRKGSGFAVVVKPGRGYGPFL
jgi:hypothetical protein